MVRQVSETARLEKGDNLLEKKANPWLNIIKKTGIGVTILLALASCKKEDIDTQAPQINGLEEVLKVPQGAKNGAVLDSFTSTDDKSCPTVLVTNETDGIGGKVGLVNNKNGNYDLTLLGDVDIEGKITVTSTDASGNSTSKEVSILPPDAVGKPTVGKTTHSVTENSAGGTVVGNIEAQDDGSIVSVEIKGGSDKFQVDNAGNIKVKPGANIDYEATPTLYLQMEITDDEGNITQSTIKINVGNIAPDGVVPRDSLGVFTKYDSQGNVLFADKVGTIDQVMKDGVKISESWKGYNQRYNSQIAEFDASTIGLGIGANLDNLQGLADLNPNVTAHGTYLLNDDGQNHLKNSHGLVMWGSRAPSPASEKMTKRLALLMQNGVLSNGFNIQNDADMYDWPSLLPMRQKWADNYALPKTTQDAKRIAAVTKEELGWQ